MKTTSK